MSWIKTSEQGYPPAGTWCWAYSKFVFIACHDKSSANGWTNFDTWEDFNNEVTHYQIISQPIPPEPS